MMGILLKFLIILILLGSGFSASVLAQSDGSKLSGLSLESKASLYSADINIREKKGEKVTEDEKKDDKARKSLGIGESVTLTLEGKSFLMEPIKDIQWSIDKGRNLLEDINDRKLKGTTELSLSVKKTLTKDDVKEKIRISVKVKQQEYSPEPIELEAILPNKLTAAHIPSGKILGSPSTMALPETESWVGASMQVKISVEPTNVNFSNIEITEQDGGETPLEGTRGSLSQKHNADSIWKISNCHEFDTPDNVGVCKKSISLDDPALEYENKFTWECLFKTSNGEVLIDENGKLVNNREFKPVYKAFEIVEKVSQEFVYYLGLKLSEVVVKVSKYSQPKCIVERKNGKSQTYTTDKNAIHSITISNP